MSYKSEAERFLEHHGVLGMRWGVRKEERSTNDIVVQKGTELHNISDKTIRDITGMVYTSHTQADILKYRANLASSRLINDDQVFENVFKAKKTIKAPSEQKAYDAFKKIYDQDPEGMLRSLANARKDMYISAAIAHRIFKMDRDDVYYKRLSKKGENWINQKGLDEFTRSLGTESQRVSKTKNEYFAELTKQGFNAILDINDTKYGYKSEQPLIIFDGTSTLKRKATIPLGKREIENALTEYLAFERKGGD